MRSLLASSVLVLVAAAGCGRPSPIVAADGRLEVVIAGSGAVAADGIDCGSDCGATIDIGTEVELVATAGAGRAFGDWDGPCAGYAESCSFTFTGDTTLTARFGVLLTVQTSGGGVGLVVSSGADTAIDCGTTCSHVYDEGVTVALVPLADSSSSAFTGWQGVTSTSGAVGLVLMKGPQTASARFYKRGRVLSARSWGDDNDDRVWGVDIDPATGDVITCGYFQNDVDFGNGVIASQQRDGFLTRRTTAGALLWRAILRDPSLNNSADEVHACKVDGTGVVAAGIRASDNDYDFTGDGAPDILGGATQQQDGFVARFTLDTGVFQWISGNTGNQSTGDNGDQLYALAVGENNVYAGGNIGNSNDAFIQRYNSTSGTPQNPTTSTAIVGTTDTSVRAMARDPNDDEVVFTGSYGTAVTYGDVYNSNNNTRDVIVGRSNNTTGTPQWAVSLGGDQNDEGESVAIDPTGLIAVTGHVDDTVFVAVFADDGAMLHYRQFGPGTGNDIGWSIAWTSDGGLLLAGSFSNTADLGTGPITVNGPTDAFVMRLDAAFQVVWVRTFGGTGNDEARSVVEGLDGDVWVGGAFNGVLDLEGDDGPLTSNGNFDGFLLRLVP